MEVEKDVENKDVDTAETGKSETLVNEKSFSQADVDKIVRERLAKEKRSADNVKESYESEKTSLTQANEAYESVLADLIKPQLESIPAEFKELVEALPLLERVKWLTKHSSGKNTAEKRFIRSTPQTEENNSNKPVYTKTGKLF